MKKVTELMPLVALKKQNSQTVRENYIDIVNKLFADLKACCPAMFNTLKNTAELNIIKQQWVLAFIENCITPAMINAGMTIARQQSNPFMPAVGQFIAWCEKGLAVRYGLLSPADLVKKLEKYCASQGIEYWCDYGCDANYWLVTDLYREMIGENLNKKQLLERAEQQITAMAKKLMSGYMIPSPAKSLPRTVKTKPLTREQQLSKIEGIKRQFGFNYALQQTINAS